ncbi:hypothetical protein Taro_029820 [Colocasia esculenta]|uniref:Stigma-specific STIG1-like protein 1 n=1 Tax=Colocasia esculenta TaxID=4460 RepID=A0A843VYC8_COLES|nr:hypothetical protein [Colocasia esculenta]
MKPGFLLSAAVVLALPFVLATATSPDEAGNDAPGTSAALGGARYNDDLGMTSLRRGRFPASSKPRNTVTCSARSPLVCMYAGRAGPDCCGGECVDMDSDVYNCGRCGKVCGFAKSCCNGKCVELNVDERHCGSCFNKCQKGVLCVYGMCNYAKQGDP